MNEKTSTDYSAGEELANSITHGIGFALGIACLAVLVAFSAVRQGVWEIVSCSVYGATLIMLYLSSTLYHAITHPKAKRVMKVLDHASIYLLIAGTYTPFTLSPLRGAFGWTIFGIIWGCALMGILFKAFYTGRFKAFSLASYLVMGFFVLVAVKPLYQQLSTAGFVFLATGGLFYAVGAIFYAWKSMPWSHAVWHLFVLTGSLCHFFSILFGVAL